MHLKGTLALPPYLPLPPPGSFAIPPRCPLPPFLPSCPPAVLPLLPVVDFSRQPVMSYELTMTLANTHVGGSAAIGSRDVVSFVPSSLGLPTILLLTPGSLPLPIGPETG
jgi:hypothetical protein